MPSLTPWLALSAGNTRLHWGLFNDLTLQAVWHTRHLSPAGVEALIHNQFSRDSWAAWMADAVPPEIPPAGMGAIALYMASVVPTQTQLWQGYAPRQEIQLSQIPLENLYPTLGIDRALNLLGAGSHYGWPALVVDAGTALTFTQGDRGRFLGGAIAPGFATQFQTLAHTTAALPHTGIPATAPSRWAMDTPEAIRSGIWHGFMATVRDFVADWRITNPAGSVVVTGGDGETVMAAWGDRPPALIHDPDLVFRGIQVYHQGLKAPPG